MNSAPVVSVVDFATVLLGNPIQVASLFSVSDPDGDAITRFEFTDLNGAALTGRFRLGGSFQGNGSTFEINASQLGALQYVGGSDISNEQIQIRAFDGELWSAARTLGLYTTRQNTTRPVIESGPSFALANEVRVASAFLSASDPDGFPILRYFLRDRRVDGSFFTLNGERLEEGVYHNVQAEDLPNLRYNGFGSGVDIIDAFAWDGAQWSVASSERITTIGNFNRPSVQFNRREIGVNTNTTVADAIIFSDADGNTPKFVELFDTGPHSFTGALVFNGQELASKEWHRFAYSDLENITYNAGERTHSEQIRVRVSDGRFLSTNSTIVFDSVEVPVVGHDPLIVSQHITFTPLQDIFAQADSGTSYLEYEVIELGGVTGDVSGRLVSSFDGTLATGELFSFTPTEFNNTGFASGAYEQRSTDELLIRARNDQGWGEWTRATVRTEPAGDDALLQQISNAPVTFNSWLNFTPILNPGRPANEIPFSFLQNFPLYNPPGEANANNFSVVTPDARQNVRDALAEVSSIANINFVEVQDTVINETTGLRGGLLRFGDYTQIASNTLGYTFLPSLEELAGDIFFNIGLLGTDFERGTLGFETVIHEIGHALGFEHAFAGQAPFLPPVTNSYDFTVLGEVPSINGTIGTYQLYDILHLQRLYGAAENNPGDTLYDAAAFYNGADSVAAVWDSGGIDTLSAAGTAVNFATGAQIDLREGSRNSFGSLENNITIAFDTSIENAIGSSRGDIISGNNLNNTLSGGEGADELYGRGGDDLLQGGADNDTYIFGIADGQDVISEERLAGRDTIRLVSTPGLDNFEEDLQFRIDGRDLVIDLNLNGENTTQESIRIENQLWGSWRIESLEIGDTRVDLTDVFSKASSDSQNFRLLTTSSVFGSLVVPT